MDKKTLKQVFISVLIGACVAFLSTLFQGLADMLKEYAVQGISATASAFSYLVSRKIV